MEKKNEEKKERYKPTKEGERYWCVITELPARVGRVMYAGMDWQEKDIVNGNCFDNQEEAEKIAREINKLFKK